MTLVDLADCPFVPWRNGGGRTRELLAWPQPDAWQVRVSVAEIEADGPFSAFAGVDRCFAVLAGAGVVLSLPGGPRHVVAGGDAVAFDGEAAPACRLLDGPTQDLNLMVRRTAGRATMRRGPPPAARWRGVYAGGRLAWTDDPDEPLPAWDAAWGLAMEAR